MCGAAWSLCAGSFIMASASPTTPRPYPWTEVSAAPSTFASPASSLIPTAPTSLKVIRGRSDRTFAVITRLAPWHLLSSLRLQVGWYVACAARLPITLQIFVWQRAVLYSPTTALSVLTISLPAAASRITNTWTSAGASSALKVQMRKETPDQTKLVLLLSCFLHLRFIFYFTLRLRIIVRWKIKYR